MERTEQEGTKQATRRGYRIAGSIRQSRILCRLNRRLQSALGSADMTNPGKMARSNMARAFSQDPLGLSGLRGTRTCRGHLHREVLTRSRCIFPYAESNTD